MVLGRRRSSNFSMNKSFRSDVLMMIFSYGDSTGGLGYVHGVDSIKEPGETVLRGICKVVVQGHQENGLDGEACYTSLHDGDEAHIP